MQPFDAENAVIANLGQQLFGVAEQLLLGGGAEVCRDLAETSRAKIGWVLAQSPVGSHSKHPAVGVAIPVAVENITVPAHDHSLHDHRTQAVPGDVIEQVLAGGEHGVFFERPLDVDAVVKRLQ